MDYVKSFKDLEVYKLARKLAGEIYESTKKFPKEEMYSLTSQLRNSSRSIGAQIAEAWAKRCYEKHFISKLTDADGELQETEHWLETAHDCGYLTCHELKYFSNTYADLGRMLNSMINKSNVFCK
ncbi:MAG: four helix bundle protein [Elusimicrobia bacterium]|nr:four helix bundle protein [Elusimicrobiota bacterium]